MFFRDYALAIFDIDKDDLLRLSDVLLEELIARLAEAEVSANGYSPAYVRWSGSINAPDGGIDIHVQVPVKNLSTGFLERPDTILQAKKHSMGKSAITREMYGDEQLSATISEQAQKGGSYIIVSLADDCSPTMRADRLNVMQEALKNDPTSDKIRLDFYDRSKLAQWLRQHPSVLLWVKEKLGQGYSGWKPYGAWSHPPSGMEDTLIDDEGVVITLPQGMKLGIKGAIGPLRELIRTTSKAVRLTGLSGVGKTRIVQALFDETIGVNPLNRTEVVYVDTGDSPDPSATAMLERLMSEGRTATLVLDNCPSELHSSLAQKVSADGVKVRLITIEYDISDGKPQTTEVIHIEAVGPQIAEKLLLRRFPAVGQLNSRRIAEFADGNARVALAIAERVEEGESLAKLSDEQLFSRLFEQRKFSNDDLREQAEILALVYSFSVSSSGDEGNELNILASILDTPRSKLFRAVNLLSERHIIQQRSHWRAILPQVIANRLAASALSSFPVDEVREAFEQANSPRLLMSFAHRIGLLHDHPVVSEIVEVWLGSEGLLGKLLELDPRHQQILRYVAPAAPEAVLDCIERELVTADYVIPTTGYRTCRNTILGLLKSIAYVPDLFDRSVKILLRIADGEKENNNHDSALGILEGFFKAYLSGTHASLQQRISVIRGCLQHESSGRRSLGLKMLRTALADHFTGYGSRDFGARPRDYGFYPNHDELLEWRNEFIGIAVELGASKDSDLKSPARGALANAFSGLWGQEHLRPKLLESARLVHQNSSWSEGLHAVRAINYFSRKDNDGDASQVSIDLIKLETELEPTDLIDRIQAYVFPTRHSYWSLDSELECDGAEKYEESSKRLVNRAKRLGAEFSASRLSFSELGEQLFGQDQMSLVQCFGYGLVQGASDIPNCWRLLIEYLDLVKPEISTYGVFAGFIEAVDSTDREAAQEFLNQCAQHKALRRVLILLHPAHSFTEKDLDRCVSVLECSGVNLRLYESFLWRKEYSGLPILRINDLAWSIFELPMGDGVLLEALNMKLHGEDADSDVLGPELRKIGLKAAIQRFQREDRDVDGTSDYALEKVICSCLKFDGNESLKLEWLDTIFKIVDRCYGYVSGFDRTLETTIALMPQEFLVRVFDTQEEMRELRLIFIQRSGVDRSPLAKVDVTDLVQWCRQREDNSVWVELAYGLKHWSMSSNGQRGISVSAAAINFLEAAPDPESVLEVFAENVTPDIWSGSRAEVMQPRADAIASLASHDRPDIASAARRVYSELLDEIEGIRRREQQSDEVTEQRFE